MDNLVKQVVSSAIPPNESIRSSDFLGSVKSLQEKIIDLFRFSSLQHLSPFLTTMIKTITTDSQSQDKRHRYVSAVCVTVLIQLFPFDDYVVHYRPIIENLLIPGYKPIVQIGSIVVTRLGKICGPNRDNFLHDLIERSGRELSQSQNPDSRYAAAAIWDAIGEVAPEFFFMMNTRFVETVSSIIQTCDRQCCELIVDLVDNLFHSKAASLGAVFLTEIRDLLIYAITKNFSEVNINDEIIVDFQLLEVLLRTKPHIGKKSAENLLLPQCLSLMQNSDFDIMQHSITIICILYEVQTISVSQETFKTMLDILVKWGLKFPQKTCPLLTDFLCHFANQASHQLDYIYNIFNIFITQLPMDVGPILSFSLIVSAIDSLPVNINIVHILSIITRIIASSSVPVPLHKLLKVLNKSHPKWVNHFISFRNTIMHIIRRELRQTNIRTDRILISLHSLLQMNSLNYSDAIELLSLVINLTNSKDLEVRELIVASSFHLFANLNDTIPVPFILKLVSFAVSDPVMIVRRKSLDAFVPKTYCYICQQDVFCIFSRFVYDESVIIRKKALSIITELPSVNITMLRNMLISTVKQMNNNFNLIVPESLPNWITFPHIIEACKPILPLYGSIIFSRLLTMLQKRFTQNAPQERLNVYMNSAILQDVDESLIKSVSTLRHLIPSAAPIEPILDVFCSILEQPVHPWTKVHVLKSLKNLAKEEIIYDKCKKLIPTLISIIRDSNSYKLVTKTLKVIGTIGFSQPEPIITKTPFNFKSSMSSRNQIHFKLFYLNTLFSYLINLFQTINLDSTRLNVTKVVISVFQLEQDIIPQYIGQFLDVYLQFVQTATSDKLTEYIFALKQIIETAGHLISPYTNKIFVALQNHWHENFTAETSAVFTSLVKVTFGRCDSIFHQLVSVSFLLIKSKPDSDVFSTELFSLLRSISYYSEDYLPTIINGVLNFLSNSSSPPSIQSESLDTIEYIAKFCNSSEHIDSIIRCLQAITLRSQMRWRERAQQILDDLGNLKYFTQKSLVKMPDFNFGLNDSPTQLKNQRFENKEFEPIDYETVLVKLTPPLGRSQAAITGFLKTCNQWFATAREFLVENSPSPLIRVMSFLPSLPNFAFKFAFLQVYLIMDESQRNNTSQLLNNFFRLKTLPTYVLKQYLELVEFAFLCEIDLQVDVVLIVKQCFNVKCYDKALLFLEFSSKSLEMQKSTNLVAFPQMELMDKELPEKIENQEEKPKSVKNEQSSTTITSSLDEIELNSQWIVDNLINANHSLSRRQEALMVASLYPEEVCYSSWIKLSEWEKALKLMQAMTDTRPYVVETVTCLAALEDWNAVKQYEEEFQLQNLWDQGILARNFSQAEDLAGNKEMALKFVNRTGGYSVTDCIQKAILLFKYGDNENAKKSIHLGWRYLASLITSLQKQNDTLLHDQLFQATELHELSMVSHLHEKIESIQSHNSTIMINNIIVKDDSPQELISANEKEVMKKRLKFIKKDCSRLKELWKIRSLEPEIIDLEDFAFHILRSSSKLYQVIPTQNLIRLFFPPENDNEESVKAKFATLLVSTSLDKQSSIEEAQNLLDSLNSSPATQDKFRNRVSKYIGSLKFKQVKNIKDVENCFSYFTLPECIPSIKSLNCLLYLVHYYYQNDQQKAELYLKQILEIILKMIKHKKLDISLLIHLILSLLVNFPLLSSLIINSLDSISPAILFKAKDIFIDLLSHPNSTISSYAFQSLCTLIDNYPQPLCCSLLILSQELEKKTCPEFYTKYINDLRAILQRDHSPLLSQLLVVLNKFEKLSFTLPDRMISHLSSALKFSSSGDQDSAIASIKELLPVLNSFDLCRFEQEFSLQFSSDIISLSESQSLDYERAKSLLNKITKSLDALRIVPIASIDPQMEHRSNWLLTVFGHNSGDQIAKFGQVLERTDNGFKISVISTSGQKFNYVISRSSSALNNETLYNIISEICQNTAPCISKASVISIGTEVTLIEQLKGHIPFYDFVCFYNQSKGRNIEEELLQQGSIWEASENKEKLIKRLAKGHELDLARGLLVTSQDSSQWISRQSNFVKTMATLSSFSFILGAVDMSPSGILLDKTTGAVTSAKFETSGKMCAVPFRLTRMFRKAFGFVGVAGPFAENMRNLLKKIRGRGELISNVLQFAVGKNFQNGLMPSQYSEIAEVKRQKVNDQQEDVDNIFNRVFLTIQTDENKANNLNQSIQNLINEAASDKNLVQMGANWIPWW